MVYDILALSIFLFAACIIFYIGCKIENKRQRKINALVDEMYLYFIKLNNKEF